MPGIAAKTASEPHDQGFAKEVVSVGTHDEAPDDRACWFGRPAEERIAGIEFLGRQFDSQPRSGERE